MSNDDPDFQFGTVMIGLMKGLLDRAEDETLWIRLLRYQSRVRDYVRILGLELRMDEAEGFAWLAQRQPAEGEAALPRLMVRHRLSYRLSLLLALLRRRLAEQDAKGGDLRLILTLDDMQSMVSVFLPQVGNEAKRRDSIASQVAKAEELGFLRRLSAGQQAWEVRRILTAFIDAQWLNEFDAKLEAYKQIEEDDNADGTDE